MDQPRDIFVFVGVFVILAISPIIPVIAVTRVPEYAESLGWASYIQIFVDFLRAGGAYRVETYSIVAVAGMIVVGIVLGIWIINYLNNRHQS